MEPKRCSIGTAKNDACVRGGFQKRSNLSEREIHLLEIRTAASIASVCAKHRKRYLGDFSFFERFCCDPQQKHVNVLRKRKLWTITSIVHDQCRSRLPNVIEGKKLCIPCKKDVMQAIGNQGASTSAGLRQQADLPDQSPAEPQAASSKMGVSSSDKGGSEETDHDGSSDVYSTDEKALENANKTLGALGQSPLKAKSTQSKTYQQKKIKKSQSVLLTSLERAMRSKVGKKPTQNVPKRTLPESSDEDVDYTMAGKIMIDQLKEKLQTADSFSEKIHILSVLPRDWSKESIMTMFGVSRYFVDKLKKCVDEDGIFCSTNSKKGRSLDKETIKKVKQFYYEPDISRELPGKKECRSVIEDGQRVTKQKRLVLGNLSEVYRAFKEKYPNDKVGFSKFAELRPAECVLAGSSGTHTVCVCLIHQNFKLKFAGAKLDQLTLSDGTVPFKSYRDCLNSIICESPSTECYYGKCAKCPGNDHLREVLQELISENHVEEITYKQWSQVDRCQLDTVVQTADLFIDSFVESAPRVLQHDYTAKKQSEHFSTVRDNLKVGEVLVVADFSENYSIVLQDSVQGVHWNNEQATVHPFACYVRPTEESAVKPFNVVVISENLDHNTTSVHAFQAAFMKELKKEVPGLQKVIYFSDGCAGQYKNRFNMSNLCHHEEDFRVPAEWHFFATSHGKGPSDGLGGTVKRLASRASLQMVDNQIKSAADLFKWADQHIQGMKFIYLTSEDVDRAKKQLNNRFQDVDSIDGIRSSHAAIPIANDRLLVKVLSSDTEGKEFAVKKVPLSAPKRHGVTTRASTKRTQPQPDREQKRRRK